MVVAVLALVIALSSTATAALMITGKNIKDHSVTGKDLKKNAVNSKAIKDKSVKGKDLKEKSVGSSVIKDGAVTSKDIGAGAITSDKLATGSVTKEQVSTTLLQTITSGASGFQVVSVASEGPPALVKRVVEASCPAGKVAISASAHSDGAADVVGPEVVRTGNATFTAEDPFVLATLGAGALVLQVTCVNAG